MGDDLRDELLRNAVRTQLRVQNVKLWVPPYSEESGKPNNASLEVCVPLCLLYHSNLLPVLLQEFRH